MLDPYPRLTAGFARQLSRHPQKPSVAEVERSGGPERQIQVAVSPRSAASHRTEDHGEAKAPVSSKQAAHSHRVHRLRLIARTPPSPATMPVAAGGSKLTAS